LRMEMPKLSQNCREKESLARCITLEKVDDSRQRVGGVVAV
jgi:hypothetical protein